MKTFKYKWKLGDKVFMGTKDCIDHEDLKEKINLLGGQLIEILGESEKIELPKEKVEIPILPQNAPAPQKAAVKRLIGISILGYLNILFSLFFYGLILFIIAAKKPVTFNGNPISDSKTISLLFAVSFFIAAIPLILGVAILRLKQWARITILVLSALSIVNSIFMAIAHAHINIPIGEIVVLWYLNKEDVVRQFSSKEK